MGNLLESSIARVYKNNGNEVVGAAFLISQRYIMTCAHVVAYALGDKKIVINSIKPESELEVDFPVVDPTPKIKTKVVAWYPIQLQSNQLLQDIAVLEIISALPEEVKPVRVRSSENIDMLRHKFSALGFPVQGSRGKWADGIIQGRVEGKLIQIMGDKVTGIRLQPGFSGTAIWNEEFKRVVGMAVQEYTEQPEAKVAFMIPTELLLKAWDEWSEIDEGSEIKDISQVPEFIPELITLLQPYYKTLKDKIVWAYQQVLYETLSINLPLELPGSLDELVTKLNQFKDDDFSCLNIFVGYLILRLQEKEFPELYKSLVKWLAQYQIKYQDFLELLRQKQNAKSAKKPCLLICIFERNSGLTLQAGLIKDIKKYSLNQEIEYKSLTQDKEIELELSELTHHIRAIFQKSLEICQSNIKLIKIFLPYKFIECDINPLDTLIIDETVAEYVQQSFGSEYEVTIGFSERLGKINPYIAKWQDKCQTLKQIKSMKSLKECLISVESSNPRTLFKKLSVDEVIGARINNIIQLSHLKSTMEVFYHAGIPVALWIRKEFQGINHQEELEYFCQECCLETLSAKLKAKRQEASDKENHIGNHLSLLWDDAGLIPPKHLLQMPEL